MKVLVTGGAGFIGSHVVDKLLEEGHIVTVLDNFSKGSYKNPKAKVVMKDICALDMEVAFADHPEIVIHLAAQVSVPKSIEHPIHDAEVNIIGTLRILQACQKYGVKKIIYITSAADIGEPRYFPIDEEHLLVPISPYGLSKAGGEEYVKWFSQQYNLEYTILRFSNVYGPRQNTQGEGGVVALFADSLLSGKPITVYGDGKQTRDFVYVEDAAEAVLSVLIKGNKHKFNVGSGKETSIQNLLNIMVELSGGEWSLANLSLSYLPSRAGDIKRSVFAVHKIKKEVGWVPKTTLEEGLKQTKAYYEKRS